MSEAKTKTVGFPDDEKKNLPAMPFDYGEDFGLGTEGSRIEEQLTPFLRIVEYGSPQVKRGREEYDAEARPGMLLNTATGELYDGERGVDVVVCARHYHYGAWIDFDSGGGFRGIIDPDDKMVKDAIKAQGSYKALKINRENDGKIEEQQLVETTNLYVLYGVNLDQDAGMRAIIRFKSTSLKVSKAWYTKHLNWLYPQPDGSRKPANLWAYRWRLQVVPDKSGEYDFFNYRMTLLDRGRQPTIIARDALLDPRGELYQSGRAFYEQFRAGQLKVDYETGGSGSPDDEVPF